MKHIKLFEGFSESEDYITDSIRAILIELEDEGMEVEINYHPEDFKYDRPSYALEEPKKTIIQPYVVIEIKGKEVNNYPVQVHELFEVDGIRDYIDTVIDFIEGVWTTYDLYFEKYDVDDAHIYDGKVLPSGQVGSVVIQIYKREL